MYPAIELKHAALEHLVCDVCACPALEGSGHEFWVAWQV